jgi:N-acetylglucosamine kinase-like BadF-type ATPase
MSPNKAAGERLFLGVDGGATKTLAVVVDTSGRERGRGMAGSGNHESVGFERAVRNVRKAVDAAVQATGAALPFEAAWIGLAGIDRPEDRALFLPRLESLACQMQLSNDAELALAALPRWIGIALIAGTGSIAIGRGLAGTLGRTGGWGHVLGDEGSGYDLGRQALQAAFQAADGRGEPTLLLELIQRHWKLASIEEVMPLVYQRFDKAEIARLSDVVFVADQRGDAVARGILSRGAADLARHVLALSDRLGFATTVPLALGGGVFVHQRRYRQRVLRRLRARIRIGPMAVVEDPALSAARAARGLVAGEETRAPMQ